MIKKAIIILFITLIAAICYAFSPALTSFNGGQFSPLLEARSDFQRYTSGCRQLENMFVFTQGPIERRPGTQYIEDANSTTLARLIPFNYSTDDAYVLELTDECIRFFRTDANNDGGPILE